MDRRDVAVAVLMVLLSIALVGSITCGDPDVARDDAIGSFGKGRLAVARGDYEAAIPLLREYLRKYPNGRNASRAQFFLGKAYIGLGRLSEAAIEFDATVRNYPGTLEAHKSRYKLAMIAYWQGDSIEARRRFEKLADNPDGTLAPEARAMAEYLSGIESQSQNAASYGEY